MEPIVQVSHLAKRFGDTQAVADVSFSVNPGEIFGLLGPNGAGKTTTIRMMLDIFKPDAPSLFSAAGSPGQKAASATCPKSAGCTKTAGQTPPLIHLCHPQRDGRTGGPQSPGQLVERLSRRAPQKKVQELEQGHVAKGPAMLPLHEPALIVIDYSSLPDPASTRLVKQI